LIDIEIIISNLKLILEGIEMDIRCNRIIQAFLDALGLGYSILIYNKPIC